MPSSQRTAGWRITEGAALPPRLQRHGRLARGWHRALLAPPLLQLPTDLAAVLG